MRLVVLVPDCTTIEWMARVRFLPIVFKKRGRYGVIGAILCPRQGWFCIYVCTLPQLDVCLSLSRTIVWDTHKSRVLQW